MKYGFTTVIRDDLWILTQYVRCDKYRQRDNSLGVAPTCHLEVGKYVLIVGEVELDVNLGMTVIGEVLVVEWPEVGGKVCVGQVERMIPAVGEVAEIHVTKSEGLNDGDGSIIEVLDFIRATSRVKMRGNSGGWALQYDS